MYHSTLGNMLDEQLEHPGELLVAAKSRRSALLTLADGTSFLVEGDFSGTQAQCEAEARRILRQINRGSRRRR